MVAETKRNEVERLQGRVALVAGAASGIGQAIAERLADEGRRCGNGRHGRGWPEHGRFDGGWAERQAPVSAALAVDHRYAEVVQIDVGGFKSSQVGDDLIFASTASDRFESTVHYLERYPTFPNDGEYTVGLYEGSQQRAENLPVGAMLGLVKPSG